MCSLGRQNRCGRRRGLFPEAGVTSEADWASAVSETISAYGQIDILGKNAGINGSQPDRQNTNNWDEQMEVFGEGPSWSCNLHPHSAEGGAGLDSIRIVGVRPRRPAMNSNGL